GIGFQPQRLAAPGRFGGQEARPGRLGPRPAAAGAQRVQAPVGRDPVQPGAQRRPLLVLAEPPPGGQQRLLQAVRGGLDRPEDPVAVQLKLAAVRRGELAERLVVPAARPFQCRLCDHGNLLRQVRTPQRPESHRSAGPPPGVRTSDGPRGGDVSTIGTRLTRGQGWVLALTSAASLMVSLDSQVVATALPAIRLHLHASLAALEWTVNAYTLSFAVLLLTGAALGERLGRRRMLAAGVGLFTAASAACALAPSAGALIAARTVQGAGAALMLPLAL